MTAAEQLLEGFHDHGRFCRESLRIVSKAGPLVPFELQPAQAKLRKAIEKQQRARVPVRIIVLKARRVMISAGTAAEFFHRVPFLAGQQAVVVAHDFDAAKKIWEYYRGFVNHYQPFGGVVGLPRLDSKQRSKGVIGWENGSSIEVETARNLEAGRSFGIRFLQFAEFAFYKHAREVERGLMAALAKDADSMAVKESTANGVGNPFHQDWLEAADPTSGSGWEPVFFAWFEHPEYSLRFDSLDAKRRFQDSMSKDEWEMMGQFHLTLEQLQWRRRTIQDECAGSVESFHQEYPSTPEEAFLYSGRPRFSHVHLAKMPKISDAPCGELVEVAGPRVSLQFNAGARGALVVYKKPQAGRQYVIGEDICEGIDVGDGTIGGQDPDWSVANVFDRDTWEQVAKLRARMEPAAFAEYCWALIRWYNYAFNVPEKNGPGIAFIEGLLRCGCPPALIIRTVVSADEQFAPVRSTALQYLGWRTGTSSRVQLISTLDGAIRGMDVILHDPNTIAEHFSFVIKPTGKAEHQDNCHDDEVISVGLAVVGLPHPRRFWWGVGRGTGPGGGGGGGPFGGRATRERR